MLMFFENDNITEWVEVDFDKAESVKSVLRSPVDFICLFLIINNFEMEIYDRSGQEPPSSVRTKTFIFSSRKRKLYGHQMQRMIPS